MQAIEAELSELRATCHFRSLDTDHGIDFSSNDYLGFSQNSRIQERLLAFLNLNPNLGSTGSRLISGNSPQIEEVESFLLKIFDSESSLIFGSGYLANLGVMSALGGEHTEFFSDERNHASLIDGMRLSNSTRFIFKHNDSNDLESLLKKSKSKRKVIVTESIFSMDGDVAPLKDIAELASRFRAYVVIDEAHGTGTCGNNGLGLGTTVAFDPERTVFVHTCGKALGGYGAFVTTSKRLRDYFINKSRSFIYSTALPPLLIEQIRQSVLCLTEEPQHLKRLKENIEKTASLFKARGLKHSGNHIIPYIVGGNASVLYVAHTLAQSGLSVKAIRSPSVAVGTERLRITIKSFHKENELKLLTDLLWELKNAPICRWN